MINTTVLMFSPGAGGMFLSYILSNNENYVQTDTNEYFPYADDVLIHQRHHGDNSCRLFPTHGPGYATGTADGPPVDPIEGPQVKFGSLVTMHGWELESFLKQREAENDTDFTIISLNTNSIEMLEFINKLVEIKRDILQPNGYNTTGWEVANDMYKNFEHTITHTIDYKKLFIDRDTTEMQHLINWTQSPVTIEKLTEELVAYTDRNIQLIKEHDKRNNDATG
jgi:hypothetical protein